MYKRAKVYSDGNAYIAIPHTTGIRHRTPRVDDMVSVKKEIQIDENGVIVEPPKASKIPRKERQDKEIACVTCEENSPVKTIVIEVPVPRKKVFEEYYSQSSDLSFRERKEYVLEQMREHFDSEDILNRYVDEAFEKKKRNLIYRRKRMVRKAYLHGDWNYFVTFTYDDKLLDEEGFRKKLSNFLKHNVHRKGWKYIGVWERGEETDRLHFHGIFDIPKDTLPGERTEVEEYDFKTHKMRKTYPCDYITKNFGRNDFVEIDRYDLSKTLGYLMKYLEKSGEQIVYSRGLPEYRISDILEDDVIVPMGKYQDRFVLFDDFTCIDDGKVIGPCNLENFRKLPSAIN